MSSRPPTRAELRDLAGLADRKKREELDLQLLEGPNLVGEGLRARAVTAVFVRDGLAQGRWREQLDRAGLSAVPVTLLAGREFERLADVRTPSEVIAVGPRSRPVPLASLVASSRSLLYFDRVQDPGNVGAILRTAAALGVEGFLSSRGSADPTSPKALRASAGAVLRLPFAEDVDDDALRAALAVSGHRLVVPLVRGGDDLRRVEPPARYVVVAGNEGGGTGIVPNGSDLAVSIPMRGGTESLNVAAALAIVLARFELFAPGR